MYGKDDQDKKNPINIGCVLSTTPSALSTPARSYIFYGMLQPLYTLVYITINI